MEYAKPAQIRTAKNAQQVMPLAISASQITHLTLYPDSASKATAQLVNTLIKSHIHARAALRNAPTVHQQSA